MKFKIAVVQFEIKPASVEENLKRAEEFIQQAATAHADIIVFPEDITASSLTEKINLIDKKNEHRKYFQALAKKYKIAIVPDTVVEKDKSQLYNTAYYIDASGQVKAKYRKINLWLPERKELIPGDEISVFNTRFGKIGLIICYDLAFPETFRKMVKLDVAVVICPSYWSYGDAGQGLKFDADAEIKFVDAVCVARAFENEIILVFCNAGGQVTIGKKQDILIGHSQIAVPFKGCLKKLDHNHEEMFIQEVDTDILKIAEKSYQIRRDLKNRIID